MNYFRLYRIRVGNGMQTRFWKDHWIGDAPLYDLFPRLFSLEMSGDVTVATKLHGLLSDSLRRPVRGGIEAQQLAHLQNLVGTSILSNSDDRWVCNLNGDGSFQVKNIRCLLDEYCAPNDSGLLLLLVGVLGIPIKINVFAWRVYLDRLPTRLNLNRRNIQVLDQSCPVCKDAAEEVSHLFFSCPLAVDVHRLICRWWNLTWSPLSSYEEWLSWFKDIRLGSILKCMLEDNDIKTILCSADHLSQKVTHLASQITHDFSSSSSSPPVIVGVATGAFLFLTDLVRNIKLPITVDFVRAESYGSGTVSNGAPKVSCDVKLDVTGKHVVLVCFFVL
ncbi:RNA-directed DNA polymerase, eukaryota [Tanacetum coccineum]